MVFKRYPFTCLALVSTKQAKAITENPFVMPGRYQKKMLDDSYSRDMKKYHEETTNHKGVR